MLKKNTFEIIELIPQKIWSLEAVKNYMRIDGKYDDELISSLIDAALINAENFTKLTISSRRIKFICNVSHQQHFYLKYRPIKELIEVKLNYLGKENKLTNEQYHADHNLSVLHLDQKLEGSELNVEYIAGFGEGKVPPSIKHGILLHITEMYDREGTEGISLSQEIKNLYLPYRQIRV